MIATTRYLLQVLDDGSVPYVPPFSTAWAEGESPLHDALVRELATGRDSHGRFVRRWVA